MQIYVNLPVKNLKKSIEFFTALGFTFNPQFTDDNATCMIISDNISVMLLVEPYFKTFTNQEICDTKKANEVIIALAVERKEQVFTLIEKALAAGAVRNQGFKDHGFMIGDDFKDLDGHIWEIFYMSGTPPVEEKAS